MHSQSASSEAATPALVKQVTVRCAQQRAFEVFVYRMSEWWPLGTHSVGGTDASSVRADGRVGGHIVETLHDGGTAIWGTITAFDPPSRLAFTWHPGQPEDRTTTVEVTFHEAGGSTLVTLTHAGWDRRDDATGARSSYDTGWSLVLGHFTDRVSAKAARQSNGR